MNHEVYIMPKNKLPETYAVNYLGKLSRAVIVPKVGEIVHIQGHAAPVTGVHHFYGSSYVTTVVVIDLRVKE